MVKPAGTILLIFVAATCCWGKPPSCFVFKGGKVVGAFTTNLHKTDDRVSTVRFSRDEAKRALLHCQLRLSLAAAMNVDLNDRDLIHDIVFNLDSYYIQVHKYSVDGDPIIMFRAARGEYINLFGFLRPFKSVGMNKDQWHVAYDEDKKSYGRFIIDHPHFSEESHRIWKTLAKDLFVEKMLGISEKGASLKQAQ